MLFGGAMFFTDYSMSAMELARVLEERGFDRSGRRSTRISRFAQNAFSRRRRFAEGILRRDGPVRGAGGGQPGHQDHQVRHRRAARAAARRDPDRQAGRLDRPGQPGTLPVRRRRRLEPGRDGKPRHRLRQPLQADARIHRGDEGDLDEGTRGISRRVRQFRPDDRRPKPVQKPYPPIHVGGAFPHGARRAIRYGDGWIPTARGDLSVVLPKFRKMAQEAGAIPLDRSHLVRPWR